MSSSVRSAERTLAIFEAFEAAGAQMQLGQIAEACDMPLSTCHALVQTLIKRGYVFSIGRRKELYPTAKLLRLAQNITANDPFFARISDTLVELSQETGETVTVGKRQGSSVLYVSAIDGTHALRYAAKVGEHRPLHTTALGKALLSAMSDDVLARWVTEQSLEKITSRSITTGAKLLADIKKGRKQGYFFASGEHNSDLTSVAVLLQLYAEPLSVSLTGPTHRMLPLTEEHAARLLKVKHLIEE